MNYFIKKKKVRFWTITLIKIDVMAVFIYIKTTLKLKH